MQQHWSGPDLIGPFYSVQFWKGKRSVSTMCEWSCWLLKKNLLTKFQCSADGFRERFRACRPETNESFQSFGERMRHLFERWVEMSEINQTYEDVFDLILAEQFLQSVSKDL